MAFMSRSTVSLLALCLIGAYGCEDLEVRPAPAVDPGPETPTPAPEVQDEEPELLERLLRYDPSSRLTAHAALRHANAEEPKRMQPCGQP